MGVFKLPACEAGLPGVIILFKYMPLAPAYPESFRDGDCEAFVNSLLKKRGSARKRRSLRQ